MSINIPTHFAQQFATNVQLLLQQQGSRLRSAVMSGQHIGSQASPVDQIGSVEMQQVTSRFGAMGRVDASTDRRWVFPSDFELPQLIDSFDKLRLLTDPQSAYVQNAVNAAGRKMDALILAAAIGTAKTGVAAGTSTTLPAGQKVAVNFGASGSVGLTVAKMREAKRLLMAGNVDVVNDQLYMAVGATQHDNLLAEAQVVSLDYNDRPVLQDGIVVRFLGINLIHTELAAAAAQQASGDVQLACWAKSGMHLGVWEDIKTSISVRNDLSSEPWQAYVKLSCGATRLEEAKIVQITCDI